MKKRPVLTLLANDDDDDLRAAPRKSHGGARHDDVSKEDEGEKAEVEEIDELENSCDIGETTLRKDAIHISHTGVTFIAKHHQDDDVDDESNEAFYQPKRKASSSSGLISLDELETSGLIGRGCSGHVMKAQHHRAHALYAVKLVHNVYDKAKRDQMLTEIRTLYSVESPYLVDFYGAYFKDHALSLVLEYCEAGSLDKLTQQQRVGIPERIIVAMACQMLLGLYHLKQTHHFHRDIKPQNILVKADGAIKPTDFGLARELGDSHDMAQTFVGTFKFMSPERVQNQPYEVERTQPRCSTNASFGWDACTQVVQTIIECPAPTLPDDDDDDFEFSDEFRDFISSCLQKNPHQRASVQELLDAPWLQRHRATDGPRCVKTCAEWLASNQSNSSSSSRPNGATSSDAKDVGDNKYDDDEYEIEEDIDAK
ncbi:Ste/ste7 protein kinase, partial [Globisporangium splendens]